MTINRSKAIDVITKSISEKHPDWELLDACSFDQEFQLVYRYHNEIRFVKVIPNDDYNDRVYPEEPEITKEYRKAIEYAFLDWLIDAEIGDVHIAFDIACVLLKPSGNHPVKYHYSALS